MSLPPPPKASQDHDKNNFLEQTAESQSGFSVKPGAKASQPSLNVTYTGSIRAPSPNPSLISIDDTNIVRLISYDPDYIHVSDSGRDATRAHAPRTWTQKIKKAWIANKGPALVLIAQVFGTLMNVTTRILEMEGNNGQGYHPFQILFVRMGITVICASVYMWRSKTEHFPFGMKEVRPLLIARGVTGFFGVFGMYYSLLYLPLADATVITFLAPSLACWACSYLINEPFTRMEQIAAYVSLFGVILIARPMTLFSTHSVEPVPPASGDSDFTPTNATEYDDVTPTQRAMAVGVAMIGVFGAAGAYTTLRWIGKRAHPLISVNYFATWCTLVSMVMMLAVPSIGFLLPASLKDWEYLIFLGICGFVMQFLLAAGLQYEKSSRATNMVYTQMLFALAFDKLVWGTTPGTLSIIGSSLILGSAIYVAMHKENSKKVDEDRGRGVNRDEERGLMSAERDVDV
ncbi:hypothetical protein K504DRAFT_461112 [Pleomassaria siparia CBS 279.74]|uniref:EamA domain-containing protein n=1 Tax=Pleomassaria siparia CBS 279.74 TaxID=1314801 RepID=A0A6G1JX01_9PLEO|nr:hypothetical protein K504DRAFT_461112 [Pleomassaria siparia CBS 279.74]